MPRVLVPPSQVLRFKHPLPSPARVRHAPQIAARHAAVRVSAMISVTVADIADPTTPRRTIVGTAALGSVAWVESHRHGGPRVDET